MTQMKPFKILHLADIHIRGNQRHKEYTEVFKKIYDWLDNNPVDYVTICGDIWHTKTSGITPEAVTLMAEFFSTLAEKASKKLIVMLGNHDGNIRNQQRENIIATIMDLLETAKHKTVFMPTTSTYEDDNGVLFTTYSLFDPQNWDNYKPVLGKFNICLFHGSVSGCVVENGRELDETEAKKEFFSTFDISLLGDIHKRQNLAFTTTQDGKKLPALSYPGSLIQQDFGEELEKGMLLWNIHSEKSWEQIFIPLENKYSFVTFPWVGTLSGTLEQITASDVLHPGCRIRVKSTSKIPNSEKISLREKLYRLGVEDVKIDDLSASAKNLDMISVSGQELHKASLKEPDTLCSVLEAYLAENNVNLSIDTKDEMKSLLRTLLQKYVSEETVSRNTKWQPKYMSFSNLFAFGKNNTFDFTTKKGLVGLFGDNGIGKSSLFSALMFGLFGTPDKNVKLIECINNNETTANIEFCVNTQGSEYKIERQLVRKKAGSLKITKDNEEIKVEDNKIDTDRVLRKDVGEPEDFVLTSFSPTSELLNLIQQGSTKRKTFLNKILNLDWFEQIYKPVNEETTRLENILSTTNDKQMLEKLKQVQAELDELNEEIVRKELSLKKDEEQRENMLLKLNDVKATRANDKFLSKKKELDKIYSKAENTQRAVNTTEKELVELLAKKDKCTQRFSLLKLEEDNFRKFCSSLDELKNKLQSDKTSQQLAKKDLEGKKVLIKKLTVVPCGDSFPSCVHISDAHEAKVNLSEVEAAVDVLTTNMNNLQQAINEIESKNPRKSLDEIKSLEATITSLNVLENRIKQELFQRSAELTELEQAKVILMEDISSLTPSEDISDLEEQLVSEIASLATLIKTGKSRHTSILLDKGSKMKTIQQTKKTLEEREETKEKYKVWSHLKTALSKVGIPAYLLKQQLPLINQELENLFTTAGIGFTVRLGTEAGVNALDILVTDSKRGERSIEACSGMEQTLVAISMRAVLSSISTLPKTDFFIIDEGFGSLDKLHLGKCMSILNYMKTKLFKTVYVITHVNELKSQMDEVVEISTHMTEDNIYQSRVNA